MQVENFSSTKPYSRLNIAQATLLAVSLSVFTNSSSAFVLNDGWVPIQGGTVNGALEIPAGSILDFSTIKANPAIVTEDQRLIITPEGKFAKAGEPSKPLRFLIAGWNLGVAEGSFPEKAEISRYVTQLKRHGYNMVRFHFLDLTLMQNQDADFDYNRVQLDRFHFMVSELKKNGIYIITDAINANNGAYGDTTLAQLNPGYKETDRYLGHEGLTNRLYYDPIAQQHWKDLVLSLYGSENPYTGKTLLEDEVLAGIGLTNENGIVFKLITEKSSAYAWSSKMFTAWLKSKYGTDDALNQAWQDKSRFPDIQYIESIAKLQQGESIDTLVNMPDRSTQWISPRMADAQQFVYETQKSMSKWMTDYIREIGYKGFVTQYNNQGALPVEDLGRKDLQWVDMHGYFYEPTNYVSNGSVVEQFSMLGARAPYIRDIAGSRHFGKPFTVSEHGQPFWNKYRREAGLAMPAYAALQGWDGISQHSQAVRLNYAASSGRRQEAIYPFSVGLDPISRTTETLAALLYLRGDVQPAKNMVGAKFTDENVYTLSTFQGSSAHLDNQSFLNMGLVTGISLDWNGLKGEEALAGNLGDLPYSAQVTYHKPGKLDNFNSDGTVTQFSSPLLPDDAYNYEFKKIVAAQWAARVQNLKDAGILGTLNKTDASQGIYESDTGELLLESSKKQMTVKTLKTEAVVFDTLPTPITVNNLTVKLSGGGALVAISAMDLNGDLVAPANLVNSKRMLVVLSTDAQNTGMSFKDKAGRTLEKLGTQPVLIKPVKVRAALKNSNSLNLKLYSVDLKGNRRDSLPISRTGCNKVSCSGVEFTLDISKLSHGATTYFELATN